MPTQVFLFLSPLPAGANYYRELYPYGPDAAGGFNSDLAIEIDSARLNPYSTALAVADGMIRFIPGESPDVGAMVLKPSPGALADLSSTLESRGSLVFVYRNLQTDSVRTVVLAILQARTDLAFLTAKDPKDRANSFVKGGFAVRVTAGDAIGQASVKNSTSGWARMGFEVVYVPGGLPPRGEAKQDVPRGWERLQELVKANSETRRLDPVSMFSAIDGGRGPAKLSPQHTRHALLGLSTRRLLIEVRDEHDRPFAQPVSIKKDGSLLTSVAPRAGSRGTFVAEALKPGEPAMSADYEIAAPHPGPGWMLTRLPSGGVAFRSQLEELKPPAHLALQAIFMPEPTSDREEPLSWFVPNNEPAHGEKPLPRYTAGNHVTAIRDGLAVFEEYADAMRLAVRPGHFIYLAGWVLLDRFPLLYGDAESSFEKLTAKASSSGAEIKALLWDDASHPLPWKEGNRNTGPVNRINGLANGQAILDNETLVFGTHHQKFLVVNGASSASAFCGGVDINRDRRDSPRHGATGAYHDIHAKIEGPAVLDIHKSFAARWNDHPRRGNFSPVSTALSLVTPEKGSVFVQVACTYPPQKHYPFAPQGSLVPRDAFIRAIRKARKFIYIEDQYLTPYPGNNPDAAASEDTVGILNELRAALPRIDYLLIVIPNHTDQPEGRLRRSRFINALRKVDSNKVHVFYLARAGPNPGPGEVAEEGGCDNCSGGKNFRGEIYCHSKAWIVDDVIAKIGSANCSRRSYTYDSEMDLVMVDSALEDGARRFARNFRIELWSEHLELSVDERAYLVDHRQALSFWLRPEQPTRIVRYDHLQPGETSILSWDNMVDPDGR